ncbi:MAG: ADOP family duplicated permease, partial [Gemmatimonadota bacterium]|nr:ADOP family duplicated permease [Gemmatimonadota bacterium]
GVAFVENLVRDLRYALRALVREPLFVLAATASIALGVGGNLAVLSLAHELLFSAPTARRPNELVQIRVSGSSHASYQRWKDLDASGALATIAGYQIEREINWHNGQAAVSILPMLVSANFFEATGVPMALGRGFSSEEARAEREPHVVVVSHTFWQRNLEGDPNVLGRTLVLNGEPYTIVGVLPPKLRSVAGYGISPNVYLPLNRAIVPDLHAPRAAIVQLLGRLKRGQSLESGRAAMDVAARRVARLDGDTVMAGVQEFARNSNPRQALPFFVLMGIVSILVLCIACANVAGLLVARATTRRREIAIRMALGASRVRLIQQLLIEGFWLALLGTAGGLGLSVAFMQLVNRLSLPVAVPIELHLAPNGEILGEAVGLMLLTVLLCALAPALEATRRSLTGALKKEEPHFAARRFTARGILVTGQVMVSTVLLVTAFLFIRNLARTQVADPGFEVSPVLVAQVGFVHGRSSDDAHIAFLQSAVERVRALPGVQRATYARGVPLTMRGGETNGRSIRIDSRREPEHVEYARDVVGPEYFATLGIRLLQGREFVPADKPGAPRVAIVNEEFARRHFEGRNPVGRRLRFDENDERADLEIVGLVANSKHRTIGEDQRAALYEPFLQHAADLRVGFVLARTAADPGELLSPARRALSALDPSTAVEVQPMRAALAFALLPSQIGAAVLGGLGTLGLILAMLGLYAVVSYTVSRRIGEIAIRVALGATYGRIVRLVVRDAAVLVGLGLLLGLGISAFVTQPLTTFLVTGLSARDPLSFVGTVVAFAVVSLLASWLPARRVARIDPALAMRLE